jgi:hypothetical protein
MPASESSALAGPRARRVWLRGVPSALILAGLACSLYILAGQGARGLRFSGKARLPPISTQGQGQIGSLVMAMRGRAPHKVVMRAAAHGGPGEGEPGPERAHPDFKRAPEASLAEDSKFGFLPTKPVASCRHASFVDRSAFGKQTMRGGSYCADLGTGHTQVSSRVG